MESVKLLHIGRNCKHFIDIFADFRSFCCLLPGGAVPFVASWRLFAARDNLAVSDLMAMRWGNLAASLNWLNRAADRFVRVNKSYIVNVAAVGSFDSNDIYIGDTAIAISPILREAVVSRLMK